MRLGAATGTLPIGAEGGAGGGEQALVRLAMRTRRRELVPEEGSGAGANGVAMTAEADGTGSEAGRIACATRKRRKRSA